MLTAVDADQVIFPFHKNFHQAHIVFFLQWPQSQDRAKDGCRFDTDEHRCMHTARHCCPIRSDHVQVHRMFIEPSVSRAGAGMESTKDSADSRGRATDLAPSRIATKSGSSFKCCTAVRTCL